MSWASLTPELPGTMAAATDGLTAGLQAAKTALEAVRTELNAASALATEEPRGALTTAEAALTATVSAAEAAINALLDDGGAYLLLIPLPKKGLATLLDGVEDLGTTAPAGALTAQVPAGVSRLPLWRRAFSEEALFLGGNAHYLKTVGEALFDPYDDARPRFGHDAYWGYAALVAGATDVAAGVTLAAYVDRLFGSRHGSDTLAASRGHGDVVATGLRVTPSLRGGAAVVQWNPPEPQSVDDGEWQAIPVEYAVIRSERPQAMTARRVLDLFSTNNLREGLSGRYGAKVLKVGRCDGVVHRYVDVDASSVNQSYYYHVALRTRMSGPDRRDELGYDLLSSAARYRPESRRLPIRHGTPPDWSRTTSVARLMPAAERLLDRVGEAARTLSSVGSNTSSLGQLATESINREVERLTALLDEVTLNLQQLEAVFNVPSGGVHVALRTGEGNTAALLADLAQVLTDPSDPNRPAFDVGDEYVTGALIVVTGPSPSAFAGAWALLRSLLGDDSEPDPLLDGIRSIQAGVEALAPQLTVDPPSVTFNQDMTTRPPGQGDASCET